MSRRGESMMVRTLIPCAVLCIATPLTTRVTVEAQESRMVAPVTQGVVSLGQTVRGTLASPSPHAWGLVAMKGEYVEVELLPKGDHLRMRILTPDGVVRRVLDPVRIAQGKRSVRWIAEAAGQWALEIGLTDGANTASYELRWAIRRAPTDADRAVSAADSINDLATRLARLPRDSVSVTLLRRALELRESALGVSDVEVAATLQELAQLLAGRARYAEAESLALRALTIRQEQLGPENLAVARSLNQLASLSERSRLPLADSLYRGSLAMSQRLLGREHRDNILTLANLGAVLIRRRGYVDADSTLRLAVAIAERTFGIDNGRTYTPLFNLAFLYKEQGRADEAAPLYARLISMREKELGADHLDVARLVTDLAGMFERQGRYTDAELQRRRALAAFEKANRGPDTNVAYCLAALGWNLYLQGRYAEAESIQRSAMAMWEATVGPDHISGSYTLQNLAILLGSQGRYADAERLHRRALSIKEKALGLEHPEVAGSLNDLGVLFWRSARSGEAEPLFRRSLAIRENRFGAEHRVVAENLNNLGLLLVGQARYAEAEPLFRRALEIKEKADGREHLASATTLGNLGHLYALQRRFDEAEPLLRRALAIEERALGRDHPELQPALFSLGYMLINRRRYAEAESTFRRAISVGRNAKDAIDKQYTIADVYMVQGRFSEAEPIYLRALAARELTFGPTSPRTASALVDVARSAFQARRAAVSALTRLNRAVTIFDAAPTGTFNPIERIRAYSWRARIRKASGDRARALTDLAEAIRSVEELRPQVGGSEETRAIFFGRYTELFELMITWRLESRDVGAALEYAERGRARVLLDQLAAGKIDLRQSIPSDVRIPLEARESNARARLAEYQERVTRLAARTDILQDERNRQSAVATDSLRAAERDVRSVYDDIKNASALWRDLITSGGQPVPLATIQRGLVPQRSLLALYQIGEERSFLFLVPAVGAPSVVNLQVTAADASTLGVRPGALTVAALEQALGAPKAGGAAGIAAVLGQAPRGAVSAAAARSSVQQLHALRRILMPDSVWNRIRGVEQVVLIPGRGLYQLPFEALVVTVGSTDAETRYWLDDGPAIRYAASATTLYNLEQRPRARVVAAAGHKAVVSLSAPIFDGATSSSSLVGATARTDSVKLVVDARGASPVTRSSFVDGGGILAPLPGTASETDAIRAAFGVSPSSGGVVALQGREATEANLRPALLGTRFIHLATHGLVDESRGALFAALALTPPATATASDDGFLQLHEIYQLRLPEAELAVLSACATNVGSTIDSEGVFALSRGFLAAGARRVIASQWAVDDRSTADLMGGFFRTIAAAEQGGSAVDYTRALRDAKRALRRDPKWANPYFWAPFILTGAR
ncbi:MAG: CHAT domain-containing protein [Gemmatimonadaceae bacterium]|nr:CHAT domain-containing protein [Gemmatimonadaceae bacterium]